MGTWGFGPFDSDAAGDMVSGLMKPIHRVIGSKTDLGASGYYCEARAAAQFVMSAHGTDILGGPPLAVVFWALIRMRRDTEWISTWRTPRKLVRSLNDEIVVLFQVMNHCRHCRSAHPKKVFLEMAKCMEDAMKLPMPRSTFLGIRARKKRRTTRAKARSR